MYTYLSPSEFILVRILFVLSFLGVLYLFWTRAKFLFDAMKLGVPDPKPRFDDPAKRIMSVLTFVFGQKRVLMFLGGIGHFIIFWGFIMISLATLELLVNGVFPQVSFWTIPGFPLVGWLVDVVSLLVMVAIVVSLYRRFVIKPIRLKGPLSGTIDAVIILGLISTLIITYFFMGAMRISAGEVSAAWAPVSNLFTGMFPAVEEGAVTGTAKAVFGILWLLHVTALFFFIYYIPRSKHLHLLGSIPNIYLRDFGPTGVINKMDLEDENAESFGVNAIEQFTWKQLLDTFSCTECGRCQEQCPAFNTGKTLTPKGIIHELKEHLIERAPVLLKEGKMNFEQLEEMKEKYEILTKNLIGDVISEEAIWACTSCQACQTACPVWIEHVQLIMDMRRYLVLTESKMSNEVQLALRNMEKNSNPWGLGQQLRAEWAAGLDIPTMAEKGENGAEYLLYLGCSASLDQQNTPIAIATAKILKAAGVDFAILGEEELCCGETARRLGNEYLSAAMMQGNVEIFNGYNVKKIITVCPHGYNTLKHEYKQFGGDYEVYHHTEFIKMLLDQGKIKLKKKVDLGNLVFHDSCYLGRYNEIYDQPRELIEKATSKPAIEMSKHHKFSFCCGAGGGAYWMEETVGERINIARTRMALEAGADTICTACPFCYCMFTDGIKYLEKENIKVTDISQVVLNAMDI
ncbi:MAG: heterodisulfide reductase-related iron-sulfur binding cluster [Syntrophobacteraceae bacterium]